MDNSYLVHHGIKGMKWGVRRFEDASGHLTPEGKRRYAIQDARKYYKINRLQRAKEKNRDPDKNERLSKRIRRVQTRSDRKHADLSNKDLNIGRQIVAKNRRNWAMVGTAAKAAATAAGAYALYQNPKTRALVPAALVAGGAVTYGSAKKVPYYTMEARRYKQVNPKGATKKGLTKKQKALRKAGKVAATAALAGAAGYALYKSGAANKAMNAGKMAVDKKLGRKVASDATLDILEANKDATNAKVKYTAKEAGKDAARMAGRGIKAGARKLGSSITSDTAKSGYRKVKNAATSRVKRAAGNYIARKIREGVDSEDPRTYIQAVRNGKQLAKDTKRYAGAANKLRKGDKMGALVDMSDEINSSINKVSGGVKNKVTKIKKHYKKG